MKKLKKTALKFEKEVVTALTTNELENVKGGGDIVATIKGQVCVTSVQFICKLSIKVTECDRDSRINPCIPQTEYNSCWCANM